MISRSLFCLLLVSFTVGCEEKPTSGSGTARTAPDVSAPANEAAAPAVADSGGEAAAAEASTIVIDVRSKEEWDTGHVETAVHIPHTEIADRIGEVTEDKDAKIVVYCKVGGRAGIAKESLEGLGFTNVENGGGFDDVKDRF